MSNKFFFIGIKGTGMAALATILHDLGNDVSGSDLPKHFFTEKPLVDRNIKIYDFDSKDFEVGSTIIIGNAFDETFPEVKKARENSDVLCYRYHEYVGKMMNNYVSISVAGSHGKTTTTGILASMLGYNFNTGYIIGDGTGEIDKSSKYLCVESCEYRRHFLSYYPDYAIITNIEIDHVDYFKSSEDYLLAYQQFTKNIKKALIIFGDDKENRKLDLKCDHYWYGEGDNNDIQAKNYLQNTNNMEFDLYFKNKYMYHFKLPLVGRHLLWNVLGVITIGILEGIPFNKIEEGISKFQGTKRRFVVEEIGENVYIDDYAHHPTEISFTIDAARNRYPDKKIVAIFKPHRVSRVLYFAEEFSKELLKADKVYLCDFTSIDDMEEGIDIDIRYLQKRILNSEIIEENDDGARRLVKENPAVYLFMSSKDIYGLAEIVKRYQSS
ncbi:MAG: UDP-N-acetylmuramate--L-alanine ligase [Anaerorhabdus sp.]